MPGVAVTDESLGEWGEATATFSEDRVHRFLLTRTWDEVLPRVNFVMLNPSTADAFQLDPTNRRCVGFAREWGFGGVVTTNIFAFRSTDPKGLRTATDPIGAENDAFIVDAAQSCDVVIAAWGTHGALGGRGDEVRELLRGAGVPLSVLRVTAGGHPSHPLYLPAALRPVAWE